MSSEMEDLNNNEEFAAVPDSLIPDISSSNAGKLICTLLDDEQAVPILDPAQSITGSNQFNELSWPQHNVHLDFHFPDNHVLSPPPVVPSHTLYDEFLNYEGAVTQSRMTSSYSSPFVPSDLPSTSSADVRSRPQDDDDNAYETNLRHLSVSSSTSTTSSESDAVITPPMLHCPVCYRVFRHKLSLTNHQRAHGNKHPHLCTICGETFKYKTNFKRHGRAHVREMRICRYCGTKMQSDYDLVQHEKEHRRQQKQH